MNLIEQVIRKKAFEIQMQNGHDAKNCPLCKYCLQHEYMLLKSYEMNTAIIRSITPDELGIENIKEAFSITYDLASKSIEFAKNPGWQKGTQLVFELAEFRSWLPIYKQAIKESKDLTDKEVKQLNEFFKLQIDLENNNLEDVIESGIDLILETYDNLRKSFEIAGRWKDFAGKIRTFKNDAQAA